MNATTMVKELQFRLSEGSIGISVHLNGEGIATILSYSIGKRAPQVFRGDEIATDVSAEGTRVTVVFENGAADEPISRLIVTLPEIVLSDATSFDVTAAALHATQTSGFARFPGPALFYDARTLKGTVTIESVASGTYGG